MKLLDDSFTIINNLENHLEMIETINEISLPKAQENTPDDSIMKSLEILLGKYNDVSI
jgi:hypothetical protein